MMKPQSYWLDYSNHEQWEDLLSRLPDYLRDVYFHPGYVGLHENRLNKAICFAYTERDKIFLYPFLLQSIPGAGNYKDISTPYGYGGPICNTSNVVFLRNALSCLRERLKSENVIVEVIKFHPLIRNQEIVKDVYDGELIRVCPTIYADIRTDNENHRWLKVYSNSNRNKIRKAERNGALVEFSTNRSAWENFRDLYEGFLFEIRASERYFFSSEYFEGFLNKLNGQYVIASCLLNQEVVSSLLVLFGKNYAHCHLLGTRKDMKKIGVNNLLHHKLILWCKDRGITKLHIGGGRGNSDDDSLLRFKMNFSNKISDFYVGERILNRPVYDYLCDEWNKKHPDKETPFLLKYRVRGNIRNSGSIL